MVMKVFVKRVTEMEALEANFEKSRVSGTSTESVMLETKHAIEIVDTWHHSVSRSVS